MRIVLIVVAALFGSALLVVAGSFALWLGADVIPQRVQPQAELTLKLDSGAGPALATRALFPAVRDGLREPRIGFAAIAASALTSRSQAASTARKQKAGCASCRTSPAQTTSMPSNSPSPRSTAARSG